VLDAEIFPGQRYRARSLRQPVPALIARILATPPNEGGAIPPHQSKYSAAQRASEAAFAWFGNHGITPILRRT
jgi:hypothetical protein